MHYFEKGKEFLRYFNSSKQKKLNLRILRRGIKRKHRKVKAFFISVARNCFLNSNKFVLIKSFRQISLTPIAMDKRRAVLKAKIFLLALLLLDRKEKVQTSQIPIYLIYSVLTAGSY